MSNQERESMLEGKMEIGREKEERRGERSVQWKQDRDREREAMGLLFKDID